MLSTVNTYYSTLEPQLQTTIYNFYLISCMMKYRQSNSSSYSWYYDAPSRWFPWIFQSVATLSRDEELTSVKPVSLKSMCQQFAGSLSCVQQSSESHWQKANKANGIDRLRSSQCTFETTSGPLLALRAKFAPSMTDINNEREPKCRLHPGNAKTLQVQRRDWRVTRFKSSETCIQNTVIPASR